ncbi:MAG: LLM class F420-dependent oxidoreductase [Deltaproteobacteria bacterium]|nr:LLM class F420-dependent oxidoreductase [Deltaproteobacteria bacterium]MBI3389677.1 LLM class F420-dependent oxidoreductase [Deltaproteobacteria bacterium]
MNLGKLALSLPLPPNVPACLDWARRSEQLGYESIWIAETGGADPFVLAGAVAQVTATARIGLAVSPVYIRTPATIAAASGTVSQLAPGRFILGLGSSSHAIVENWHGTPFHKPVTRVRETVQIVRAMLAGEKLKFNGTTLHTQGYRLMAPPAGSVPIYVGALRPPMLEVAGEVGDGVVVNLFPAAALPTMLKHVAVGARRAGKDAARFEVVCRHQVLVTNDKNGAREVFRAGLTGYFATPVYNKFAAWYGFEEEAALIAKGFKTGDREMTRKGMTDRFVDSLGIFGSLEECRERIAEFVAAGVTTTIISPLAFDPEAIRATIEGLAPR